MLFHIFSSYPSAISPAEPGALITTAVRRSDAMRPPSSPSPPPAFHAALSEIASLSSAFTSYWLLTTSGRSAREFRRRFITTGILTRYFRSSVFRRGGGKTQSGNEGAAIRFGDTFSYLDDHVPVQNESRRGKESEKLCQR